MRILGVDPGSRLAGYGCIDKIGNRLRHVTHGTLKLSEASGTSLEDRLLALYQGLSKIIAEFKPHTMVVEKVFFAKNAVSALKLGQARGAVLLTGKINSLNIVEYSATEVKLAVVGYGRADKDQVAKMVQLIVGQQKFPSADASDGLALAICHGQMLNSPVDQLSGKKPSSTSDLKVLLGKRTKKKLSLAESVGLGNIPRKKAVL